MQTNSQLLVISSMLRSSRIRHFLIPFTRTYTNNASTLRTTVASDIMCFIRQAENSIQQPELGKSFFYTAIICAFYKSIKASVATAKQKVPQVPISWQKPNGYGSKLSTPKMDGFSFSKHDHFCRSLVPEF